MSLYNLGKYLFFIYFKLFNRVEIRGRENIPKDKGVLLCSNHISNLDPPLVGAAAPRQVLFMAKAELFEVPVLKRILPRLGTFPVKRGMSDKLALRKGIEILNEGKVLGLFPEGTRSKTGELGQGLAGAGFFALRSNALIVPCAVSGSYKPFQKLQITYGKPMDFEKLRQEKSSVKDATEAIMAAIGELLEEKQ